MIREIRDCVALLRGRVNVSIVPLMIAVGVLASLAEGVGITLFIPLLQDAGGGIASRAATGYRLVDFLSGVFDAITPQRRVLAICRERRDVRHLDGHGPDPWRDVQPAQHLAILAIEISDRHRRQGERPSLTIGRARNELMVDEIELDLERSLANRHGRGTKPSRRHVEHDLPTMILHRRERESRLPDDLHPPMERGVGVLPLPERQLRPRRRAGGRAILSTLSSSNVWSARD